MRAPVSRLYTALRRWWSTLAGAKLVPLDETLHFTEEQIRFLAGRGVIYLTERPDGRFSTIIAHDFGSAANIAYWRGDAEKVIGVMGEGFLRHVRASAAQSASDSGSHAGVGTVAHA